MRNKMLIIVAVVLGLVALGLVSVVVWLNYLPQERPETTVPDGVPDGAVATVSSDTPNIPPPPPLPPKFPVLIASQDIGSGVLLKPNMVEVSKEDAAVPDAFTSKEQLNEHVTTSAIPAGSPILASKVRQGLITVLQAAVDIPANTIINENMLTTKGFEVAPPVHILADRQSEVTNSVSRVAIKAGELITPEHIYGMGGSPQLSFMIPIYKRALTIQVRNPTEINNYMVRQGDDVDVIAKFNETYAGVDVSRTIVTAAEVLALDQDMQNVPSYNVAPEGQPARFETRYSYVTLAVTQREAEKLIFASKHSEEIRVVLRSPSNTQTAPSRLNTTRETLLGDGFGQPRSVEIYNGASATRYTIAEF